MQYDKSRPVTDPVLVWVRKIAQSIKARLYFSAVWSYYVFIKGKKGGSGLLLELGELPDELMS